jgi:hypothetical protein
MILQLILNSNNKNDEMVKSHIIVMLGINLNFLYASFQYPIIISSIYTKKITKSSITFFFHKIIYPYTSFGFIIIK